MGRDEFGVLQNFDRMKECKERDDVPNLKYIQTTYIVVMAIGLGLTSQSV